MTANTHWKRQISIKLKSGMQNKLMNQRKNANKVVIEFYVLSSTKSENKRAVQGLPGFGRGEEGGGPSNVYTCK
jgi:hypothetical protein